VFFNRDVFGKRLFLCLAEGRFFGPGLSSEGRRRDHASTLDPPNSFSVKPNFPDRLLRALRM
jgi:hypothetical protein